MHYLYLKHFLKITFKRTLVFILGKFTIFIIFLILYNIIDSKWNEGSVGLNMLFFFSRDILWRNKLCPKVTFNVSNSMSPGKLCKS